MLFFVQFIVQAKSSKLFWSIYFESMHLIICQQSVYYTMWIVPAGLLKPWLLPIFDAQDYWAHVRNLWRKRVWDSESFHRLCWYQPIHLVHEGFWGHGTLHWSVTGCILDILKCFWEIWLLNSNSLPLHTLAYFHHSTSDLASRSCKKQAKMEWARQSLTNENN